jgi:hypothetical protein
MVNSRSYFSCIACLQVHIWDFSGRTTYIVMTELNRSPHDSKSADQEVSSSPSSLPSHLILLQFCWDCIVLVATFVFFVA